jgi:hypothetical protein
MLLEDLLKRIDQSGQGGVHPDVANLRAALASVGEMADGINRDIRSAATKRAYDDVCRTVADMDRVAAPHREFLNDARGIEIVVLQAKGALSMGQTRLDTYHRAILFTDMVVFCARPANPKNDPRHTIAEQVPIHMVWVDEQVPDGYKKQTSLRFLTPEQEYVVTCGSVLERDTWRSTVNNAIERWVESHAMYGSSAPDEVSGQRPRKFLHFFTSGLFEDTTYDGEWDKAKPHGVGRFDYVNKDVYEGELRAGRRFGVGTMRYRATGAVVHGQFAKDMPHGQCTLTIGTDVGGGNAAASSSTTTTAMAAGALHYEGSFYQGRRHGQGAMRFGAGEASHSYAGEFVNDRYHGQGVLELGDGSRYEGAFEGGAMHGHGVLVGGGDKMRYEGAFEGGVRHGHGKLTSADGTFEYEGDWHHGRQHGRGTMRNSLEGWIYEGEWRSGGRHGQGSISHSIDGSSYKGAWKNNRYEGQGRLHMPRAHNLVYEGAFEAGRRHGQGKLTTDHLEYEGAFVARRFEGQGALTDRATGAAYAGHWRHGLRHGDGTQHYANRATYSGSWRNNLPHESGRFTSPDGSVSYDGMWEHGTRHGRGKMITPDYVFDGQWNHDMREGNGTLTINGDGSLIVGTWAHDRLNGKATISSIASAANKRQCEYRDGVLQMQTEALLFQIFEPRLPPLNIVFPQPLFRFNS